MIYLIENLLVYDEVEGKNLEGLSKSLNLVAKRVKSRLPSEIAEGTGVFAQMHGYKIGTSVAQYEPFSLVLGDGQVLTALCQNRKQKTKKPKLSITIVVKEWFLNRRRVTEYIYTKEGGTGQNRGVDDSEVAKNIANLVIKTHDRFLNGTHVENANEVKKRIKKIEIDTSVYIKDYNHIFKALDKIEVALKTPTIESLQSIKDDIDLVEENEVLEVTNNPTYIRVIGMLEAI